MDNGTDIYQEIFDVFNETDLNITILNDYNGSGNASTDLPLSVSPKTLEQFLSLAIPKYAQISFGENYAIYHPITFVICMIGLITNGFNIVVFTRPHMINSINFFLIALSIADIVLMLSQIPTTIHCMAGFRWMFDYSWWVFFIILVSMENFGIMMTNWLMVTVGIWRLIAVLSPLRANELCSMSRAKKVLAALVILSTAVAALGYSILTVDEYKMEFGVVYAKGFTKFAKENPKYYKGFTVIMLFCTLIPSVLLVIIMVLLIVSIIEYKIKRKSTFSNNNENKNNSRQGYRTTMMLLVLLFLFLINNLPDSVINVQSFFVNKENAERTPAEKATDYLRVFSMVNNSVSFFIYYFMGVNFRKTFKKCFKCGKSLDFSKNSSSTTLSSFANSRKFSLPILFLSKKEDTDKASSNL